MSMAEIADSVKGKEVLHLRNTGEIEMTENGNKQKNTNKKSSEEKRKG